MTRDEIDVTANQCYWATFKILDLEPGLKGLDAYRIAIEVQNLVQARLTEFFK